MSLGKPARRKQTSDVDASLDHYSRVISEMETMTTDDHIREHADDLRASELSVIYVQPAMSVQPVGQSADGATSVELAQELAELKQQMRALQAEHEHQQKANFQQFEALSRQNREICGDIVEAMKYMQRVEQCVKNCNRRWIQASLRQNLEFKIMKGVMFRSGLFAEYLTGNKGSYVNRSSLRDLNRGYAARDLDEVKQRLEQTDIQLATLKDQVKFTRESAMQIIEEEAKKTRQQASELLTAFRGESEIQKQAQKDFLDFYTAKTGEHQKFLTACQTRLDNALAGQKQHQEQITKQLESIQAQTAAKTQTLAEDAAQLKIGLFELQKAVSDMQVAFRETERVRAENTVAIGQMQLAIKQNYDDYKGFVATSNIPDMQTKIEGVRRQIERILLQNEALSKADDAINQRVQQQSELVKHFQLENQQQQFDFQQALSKSASKTQEAVLQLSQVRESFSSDNFGQLVKMQVGKELVEYMQRFEAQATEITLARERSQALDQKVQNLAIQHSQLEANLRKELEELEDAWNDVTDSDTVVNGVSFAQQDAESALAGSRGIRRFKIGVQEFKRVKQHQRLQSDVLQDHGKRLVDLQDQNATMCQQFQAAQQQMQQMLKRGKADVQAEVKAFLVVKDDLTRKYVDVMKCGNGQAQFEQKMLALEPQLMRNVADVAVLQKQFAQLDLVASQSQQELGTFIQKLIGDATSDIAELRTTIQRQTQELSRLSESSLQLQTRLNEVTKAVEQAQHCTDAALVNLQSCRAEQAENAATAELTNANADKMRKALTKLVAAVRVQENDFKQINLNMQAFGEKLLQLQHVQQQCAGIPQIQQQIVFIRSQIARIDDTLSHNERRFDYLRQHAAEVQQSALSLDVLGSMRRDLAGVREKYAK